MAAIIVAVVAGMVVAGIAEKPRRWLFERWLCHSGAIMTSYPVRRRPKRFNGEYGVNAT